MLLSRTILHTTCIANSKQTSNERAVNTSSICEDARCDMERRLSILGFRRFWLTKHAPQVFPESEQLRRKRKEC